MHTYIHPDRPNPGFRPWNTYVTQVEDIQLYDAMPNQPARHLADWVSVTEQCLLQQHPWAPQGRASNLQAEYKPLTSPKVGPIWKKGKPAYWEQLQVRLGHIQHQEHPSHGTIQGFLKATESAPKHWIGEPAWAQFLDMTQHWHQHKDPRTLELMQHTIQHQLTQALEQSRTEGQLQYAAWIRQGEAKGLSELAWQRPYRTVPMADRMRHRLHDWHQHWQPTSDNQPLNRDSLHEQACTQATQLPPLTLGHLARVLKQLPDRACGPDAISTQLLRNTPPQALPSLLQLLQDMEKSATLPTQLQKLQTVAQALEYPPLALEFAMQVDTGPKAVLADAELSHWFHVTHGVAAGCPQAPLLAKAFLQPILSPFQAQHPDLHLNGWVDDIGFDGKHHNPDMLANRIVNAWQELRQALTTAGLKVNNHKTAFIVTDKATRRALAKLLGPDDPPIQSVMRDLGIDHQAGRRRRITTLQNRFKKNKQRRIKLRTLRRATSDKEAWQRILDQDHLEIYKHAGARLAKIYEDQEHYLHTKPGRATAHKTKQRKKTLIAQCQQPWQPGKHQWKAHRSGYQCHTCQTRVHQGLTAAMIEERLQEDCDQLTAPAPEPDLPPDRAVGKKPTRASRIAALLQLQQEHPTTPDVHHLQETTGYLKCTKCNQAIHKRANEELFNQFLHSTCIDAPFGQEHAAHNTHTLWQIGKSIQCKGCGLHTHLDAQDRLILTKGLLRECKGHKPTSPTLAHFFSQTNPQGRTTPPERSLSTARASTSPISGHDTQPTADSEAAAPTGSDALSPPMPKKLRFSAEMQPATQEPIATSTEEAEEEVDMAHDPEVTVDYF